MSRPTPMRTLSWLGVCAVALVVISVVGVQYAHIIGRNMALAHQLSDVRREVSTLTVRRARQEAQIRRLSDARGAIPEIHDKLHLVGNREAIVYLKGKPPAP